MTHREIHTKRVSTKRMIKNICENRVNPGKEVPEETPEGGSKDPAKDTAKTMFSTLRHIIDNIIGICLIENGESTTSDKRII